MPQKRYALDFIGFSNEDGDGCMAIFVDFPDVKGVGDTFAEAEEDAYEALERYFKNGGEKMTKFEKGVEAYNRKAYPEAYALFSEAAAGGNSDAMVNVALMYMKGIGATRDIEQAKAWFERAADAGHTHAMMSLAHICEKGLDGRVDPDKAHFYYRMAADHGVADAQLKTGMLFREKGDIPHAMHYLIEAAHNNNAQAQEIITYVSNAGVDGERNSAFRGQSEEEQREQIEAMIEKEIRPVLAADSGGIELVNYIAGETPKVWLHYLGACSGCHLGATSTADMLLQHFETLIDKNVILYLM